MEDPDEGNQETDRNTCAGLTSRHKCMSECSIQIQYRSYQYRVSLTLAYRRTMDYADEGYQQAEAALEIMSEAEAEALVACSRRRRYAVLCLCRRNTELMHLTLACRQTTEDADEGY